MTFKDLTNSRFKDLEEMVDSLDQARDEQISDATRRSRWSLVLLSCAAILVVITDDFPSSYPPLFWDATDQKRVAWLLWAALVTAFGCWLVPAFLDWSLARAHAERHRYREVRRAINKRDSCNELIMHLNDWLDRSQLRGREGSNDDFNRAVADLSRISYRAREELPGVRGDYGRAYAGLLAFVRSDVASLEAARANADEALKSWKRLRGEAVWNLHAIRVWFGLLGPFLLGLVSTTALLLWLLSGSPIPSPPIDPIGHV